MDVFEESVDLGSLHILDFSSLDNELELGKNIGLCGVDCVIRLQELRLKKSQTASWKELLLFNVWKIRRTFI